MGGRSNHSSRVRRRRAARRLCFEALESRQLLAVTTFSPVADTYTQAGVNAGSAQVLDGLDMAGDSPGDHIVYIRFDLSGVDLSDFETATLNLYKVQGSRNDTIITERFDVYGLTNSAGLTPQNWDEATLAEGNLGSEYTNTAGNGLDTSQLYNLNADTGANVSEFINQFGNPQQLSGADLLAFLSDRIDDNGLVTFITEIDANHDTQQRGWGYGSRENSNPGLRPTLELDDGEPEPDPYPENPVVYPRQMEHLNRGLVAVRSSSSEVYVGWRLLGNEPSDVAFNLYRSADGGAAVKLNGAPLTQTTDFVDTMANTNVSNEYFVRPLINGVEQETSESFVLAAGTPVRPYLSVPLQVPAGGTNPSGSYSYSAGDASVGDLDGDGDYEIVLKWDPSDQQDNSNDGYTGNVFVDAYDFDLQGNSTRLWRIDLGRNIRAGAHYTQFLVYDFDGDGKAEVVMKTAEATVDGVGTVIGNPNADYRNSSGYVLSGPEYLTVFNGETGAIMDSIEFEPERGSVASWGDTYGNRVDRFQAAPAYLDGVNPSLVWARGYAGPQSGLNARNEVAAYDYRDGELSLRWIFEAATNGEHPDYVGQTAHSITIGDVDGDGKDEVITGAAALDDDGTLLYNTGLGHGDALHLSDMDPTNPGLEVFMPHESSGAYGGASGAGGEFRDAQTGTLIFGIGATNDVGRGVAFDIDPNYFGYEMWATVSGAGPRMVYNAQGDAIYSTQGGSGGSDDINYNFGVWWDADPLRELLDGTTISKWRYDLATPNRQTILSLSGTSSNNGTKSTPSLSADLFGDWREEVIMKASNSSELRIYTTTIPATRRLTTLMHDSQYRTAIAWQNSGYNQPPHPSFYLGDGMETPPQPSIFVPGQLPGDYNDDGSVDAADYTVLRDRLGTTAILPNDTTPGTVTEDDYAVWVQFFGASSPPVEGQAAVETSEIAISSVASDLSELPQMRSADETVVRAAFAALSRPSKVVSPSVGTNSIDSDPQTTIDVSAQSLLLLSSLVDVSSPLKTAQEATSVDDNFDQADAPFAALDAAFELQDREWLALVKSLVYA